MICIMSQLSYANRVTLSPMYDSGSVRQLFPLMLCEYALSKCYSPD